MQPRHIPVFKEHAVNALNIAANDLVVDATYGGGGHARAILARLGDGGRLLVIDRDVSAIERARRALHDDARVEIIHAPFSRLRQLLSERDLSGRVAGMLFDFGVSSQQLDTPARGFSFRASGPLDMRMDQSRGQTAAQWLAQVTEQELCSALRDFGEERFARRIARAIKHAMQPSAAQPPLTTAVLAELVAKAVPSREPGKHPATRSFQAIRIAVNHELGEIREVLPQALIGLAPHGRLVILSFHSLEDRLVKRFFREQARGDPYPPELPICEAMKNPTLKLVGKPRCAGVQDIADNRRARSAVMRVAEKIGGDQTATTERARP